MINWVIPRRILAAEVIDGVVHITDTEDGTLVYLTNPTDFWDLLTVLEVWW